MSKLWRPLPCRLGLHRWRVQTAGFACERCARARDIDGTVHREQIGKASTRRSGGGVA